VPSLVKMKRDLSRFLDSALTAPTSRARRAPARGTRKARSRRR